MEEAIRGIIKAAASSQRHSVVPGERGGKCISLCWQHPCGAPNCRGLTREGVTSLHPCSLSILSVCPFPQLCLAAARSEMQALPCSPAKDPPTLARSLQTSLLYFSSLKRNFHPAKKPRQRLPHAGPPPLAQSYE